MNVVFKALNDETRRQILDMLKEKDMNAGEIAENFNISKPSISHHLDILTFDFESDSNFRDGLFTVPLQDFQNGAHPNREAGSR